MSISLCLKLKSCVSTFYILYNRTLFIKKFFTTHACFCFCVMEFRKQKNIFCTSEASLCFTQKNNFCVMNKMKLVWFCSLCTNYFWTLDVSRTASYEITLVCLSICLSVCLPVTKFSQDWIISFFWLYCTWW